MGRTKIRKPREISKKKPKALIITREEWGAKEPKSMESLQLPVYKVMIKYYTDSSSCENQLECMDSMRALQEKAFEDGLPDIPYSFCIGGDDQIYEGRGWFSNPTKVGNEMPEWEGLSLDIAYIGHRRPGRDMTTALGDLLEAGIIKKCIVGMFKYEVLSGVDVVPDKFKATIRHDEELANQRISQDQHLRSSLYPRPPGDPKRETWVL